ncbi:uncharacterized protein EURHEDRAFT_540966, partial [Aspergillus ruber CBS 135680]
WGRYPRPTAAGQISGHESVEHIIQLGAGLDDRVGLKFIHNICRTCAACLAGTESSCLKMRISGYYTAGTFQKYCLAPAEYLISIPSNIPPHLAVP